MRFDNDQSFKQARWAPSAAGVLCVLVLYFRTRSSFHSPEFWAEDGVNFWFLQAANGWRALTMTSAGYYHLIPRFVAGVSSFFDPSYAPVLFFIGCIIACFWSAATAATTVRNPLLGVLLGASLAIPPTGFGEVQGNLTNAQWLLAPTLALLLLPAALSVNRLLFAALVSLTGPFSVFLAPIAAYRLWTSKDAVSAIVLLGAIIQVFAISQSNVTPSSDGPGTIEHLAGVVLFRPFLFDAICAALGALVVIASLQSEMRGFRLVLIYLAIALSIGTLARFANSPELLDNEGNGARYFFVPRVAMIWCAISIAFIDWRNATLAVAFILSLEFAGANHLLKPPLNTSDWAKHYQAGASVIEINPKGWKVQIPGRP